MCVFGALCFIILGTSNLSGNASLDYILKYKDIAIEEMHQSGIPASIKMAQALLESGAGKSTLAREANNHFGIKCGGQWTGGTFYREDDDYHKGKLIESCFRKFKNAEESFSAHSDFLVNQKRYAFLFEFNNKDYHSWAHGLRKAGYATDKAYPQKLINLIEKYKLYELDDGYSGEIIASVESNNQNQKSKSRSSSKKKNKDSFSIRGSKKSKSKRSSRRKKSSSKRKTSSSQHYHIVEDNESLRDIAKAYKLNENALRIRNRLPKDAEVLAGEKVYLRKKISLLRRPEFIRVAEGNSIASTDYIF